MDSTREYRLCCWWKQGWGETACAHSVGADCGDQKNSLDWHKKRVIELLTEFKECEQTCIA